MKPRYAKGFTLIEMIISMVLLSFITLIGYQGLFYSANHWQKGHDKMLFQYDFHQAVSWIRHKAGVAEKIRHPTAGTSAYFFNGERQSIEFVARYSRTRKGGLYVNKVNFDAEAQVIEVAYYLYHPDNLSISENSVIDRVTLLPDVNSVTFSYYGRDTDGQLGWHESWVNKNTLPQLLRLDIVSSGGQSYQSTIHIKTSNNV